MPWDWRRCLLCAVAYVLEHIEHCQHGEEHQPQQQPGRIEEEVVHAVVRGVVGHVPPEREEERVQFHEDAGGCVVAEGGQQDGHVHQQQHQQMVQDDAIRGAEDALGLQSHVEKVQHDVEQEAVDEDVGQFDVLGA
eukprot:CAMPEP_0173232022 /NCGR_PEP_ID=MMETSP1142-20121109/8731_1 /TAXON_ID=483371 /ORGANISM="non described non described, Strain CCMP2298" /LENGTH=135 /DNA_ID=CAMNT_0014161489 /DNA_START=810 /DNA_END=1218 /DNA_ORIENTATION=+